MNQIEFDMLMEFIEGTFDRKLNSSTRTFCWSRCKDIPGIHIKAIMERLGDREKKPDNYAHAIQIAYREVSGRDSNLDAPRGCHMCDGPGRGGFITYAKLGPDGRYTIYAGACSNCYPGHKYGVSKMRLAAAGYELCMDSSRAAQSDWWSKIQRANTAHMPSGAGFFDVRMLKDLPRMRQAVGQREPAA